MTGSHSRSQLVADRVVAHEPAGLRVGHGEDDGVRVELRQRSHLPSLDGQVGGEVLDQRPQAVRALPSAPARSCCPARLRPAP